MKTLTTKRVQLPAWTTRIVLHGNGIDGWAPVHLEVLTLARFLKLADYLQRQNGGGEWDVIVYAADDAATWTTRAPYGKANRYRTLRRVTGRFRKVGEWDYMRWHRLTFSRP